MPIVSSSFAVGPTQPHGYSPVTEMHTDSNGTVHTASYLAAPGTAYATVMSARAVLIAETLADEEERAVNGGALSLKHQTKAQYLLKLRQSYLRSTQADTCRIAHRMLRHLANNECTVGEMRTAWGMTVSQWTTKAALLQLKADKWTSYRNAETAMNNEAGD